MSGLRVLLVLALAVVVGVGVDTVTGAPIRGYGAGLGAAGVVVLTLLSDVLGRWLRRDQDDTSGPGHGEAHGG